MVMATRTATKNVLVCEKKKTLPHFFVHFLAVVLHDYNVKLPETSYLHVLWRNCRMCSCSLIFPLLLVFTLVAASFFSFSHCPFQIFMFLLEQNWSPLFFISRCTSFSVSHMTSM